jgi:hypothetical protein
MYAKITVFLLALVALITAGCATTTQLTNAWVDPAYQGPPFQKLLVVGIAKTPGDRRTFEDEFSAQLRAGGVETVPSYTVVADDKIVDKSALESAVKEIGADGVIITRVVDVERQTQYSPGYVTAVPSVGYPHGMYDYYGSAGIVTPPTAYSYDVVQVETSLWQTSDAKLVWSATTQTTDPGELRKEIPGYAKIIYGALVERGLIGGGK